LPPPAPIRSASASETKHYLGVGDSPDRHREKALEVCEQLAEAYEKHFRSAGFAVSFPAQRLTVVALKDRTSYEKFLGEEAGDDEGGHYDLENNRLVIFDFRPAEGKPVNNPERVNTFTLVHEGIHQLTFNTGLLNRQGDVPLCVSEGLATYGEQWRPRSRSAFGLSNEFRRDVLARQPDLAEAWVPVAKLLTDDTLFEQADTAQLAYAQSWVFTHYHLRTSSKRPKFRAYLQSIRERRDPSNRLKDASASLGDLDRLDRDLRKHAARRS
jgi:hypothetical protein